ncbi:MAG: RNA polymerase sigma factor [Solirubrobacteraceae bacterium]
MTRLDPDALGVHVDRLFRAAWALCGSRHDAEDLVQETFVRVLARPRELHTGGELAYLMSVLRNTFLTTRRTASRRPAVVGSLDELQQVDPRRSERPHDALDTAALFAAIAALPEDFRLTLVAVDVAGLSYREAATLLDSSEATITTRLFRARRRLAGALTAEGAIREGPAPARSPV